MYASTAGDSGASSRAARRPPGRRAAAPPPAHLRPPVRRPRRAGVHAPLRVQHGQQRPHAASPSQRPVQYVSASPARIMTASLRFCWAASARDAASSNVSAIGR
ncbi:hypothetical protein [Actinophytocola xanthii]|uniref:hypothetical protein n=1 Tax=Actinophytocola xanthii TaxID=1912961 RepID=UPI00117737A3|nr:hypothetical protein [Actinophytocola xanthii]